MPNHGSGCTALTTNPGTDTNPIPNLWSGECNACMQTLHNSDISRETWAAWKKDLICGDEVRRPKLRRVEWRFWKAEEDDSLATFRDFETIDGRLVIMGVFDGDRRRKAIPLVSRPLGQPRKK